MRPVWLKDLREVKENWSALNPMYQSQVCDCVSVAWSLRQLKQLIESKWRDEFYRLCQLESTDWKPESSYKCITLSLGQTTAPENAFFFPVPSDSSFGKNRHTKTHFFFPNRIQILLNILTRNKYFFLSELRLREVEENQILSQKSSLSLSHF